MLNLLLTQYLFGIDGNLGIFLQINTWLNGLASAYWDLCTVESIGRSYEGRDMRLITVGIILSNAMG